MQEKIRQEMLDAQAPEGIHLDEEFVMELLRKILPLRMHRSR